MHNVRVTVTFHLGSNEDKAQETAPQIFERLLQRGSRGRSIHKILVKGEFRAIKNLFYKRLC